MCLPLSAGNRRSSPIRRTRNICTGHAQENTAKAEDVWDVTIGEGVSLAAVFDGHGGNKAAIRKLTNLDFETPPAATAEATRDDAVTARGVGPPPPPHVCGFTCTCGRSHTCAALLGIRAADLFHPSECRDTAPPAGGRAPRWRCRWRSRVAPVAARRAP